MIAIISDLHIHNFRVFGGVKVSGINYRCHLAIVSLHKAVGIANSAKAKCLVITGDLFDVSDPSPQIVAAVIAELQRFNGDVHVIAGNHDLFSSAEGDHALGPMHSHRTVGGKIYCWDQTVAPLWKHDSPLVRSMFVPFRPEPVADWLPKLLKEHSRQVDTLFAHFGIIDDETPKFLRAAPDAYPLGPLTELMKKHNVHRVVVGNWHEHQTWRLGSREVVQVGALIPTGFNNLGYKYGRVVLLEDGAKTRVITVPGPRFTKHVYPDISFERLSDLPLFYRVEAEPKDLVAARGILKQAKLEGKIADFELLPSKEKAKAQARNAARATSQVAALKDAVSTFVGAMPLDQGVAREKVLARVQGYLK